MEIFLEMGIILAIAVLIAGIMRVLKQPLIIGHIITGIIVGPLFLNFVQSENIIAVFAQIGVALLLFIVGLTLSPKVIREVGKTSLVTGVGQIIFTSLVGFFICLLLGFSLTASFYIALALTFSSTIIIMKLLSDKHDTRKIYGKISIGFLLVQDVVAVILLIIISSFSNGENIANLAFDLLLKGVMLVSFTAVLGLYVFPRLTNFFAKSQEFLLLFSLSWGIGLSALFYYMGFSIEIGALTAGIALSVSPYNLEISSKLKPLRDFFIILFFILLGSQMIFTDISMFIIPVIVLSVFILVGNPLIVMILMGFLGYPKRTGFSAGLTVAQISEFSLILIALGVRVGHLSGEILSLVTLIGLGTIAGSTYMIIYSDRIYSFLSKYLSVFERKNIKKMLKPIKEDYDILLFGYNRIGYDFLESFKKLRNEFLVVDYNPETIKELSKQNINCSYGDADDSEFLEELDLRGVKMIVTTIPEFETNKLIIKKARKVNPNAVIMSVAYTINQALSLYDEGASYVIMPHFLGGHHASIMTNKYGFNTKKFLNAKQKHIKYLRARIKKGHEHPKKENSS